MLPWRSTQKAPHWVSPEGQLTSIPASTPVLQTPILHKRPAGHALPQRPQCDALTDRSTQKPSQWVIPTPQTTPPSIPGGSPTHAPFEHACPVAHGRLHPPQCRVSERKFTHVPPQSICPPGHTGPTSIIGVVATSIGTTIPSGSIIIPSGSIIIPSGSIIIPSGSIIIPSGSITIPSGSIIIPSGLPPSIPTELQTPITHTCPIWQARPHPPQWVVLLVGSTHAPAHSTCPAGQAVRRSTLTGTSRDDRLTVGAVWVQASIPRTNSPARMGKRMAPESTRVSQGLATR